MQSCLSRLHLIVATSSLLLLVAACRPTIKKVPQRFACGTKTSPYHQIIRDTGFQIVFDYPAKWKQKKLKVFFIDSWDDQLQIRVITQANKWACCANIRFEQTSSASASHIRLAFREGNGYRSLVGSYADSGEYKPSTTMWLDYLDTCEAVEFNRVVLHEFGHALGLLHELQNPNSPIEWDKEALYHYYDSLYHWKKDEVNDNILTPEHADVVTQFDPASVMIYGIPAHLMKNHPEITWPLTLSRTDKDTIKKIYP